MSWVENFLIINKRGDVYQRPESSAVADPEQYSWKWDNEIQVHGAIMTKLPLAPIYHQTVCGYKTDCNTNRCKCLKNDGLKCTEMCKCENCKNVESEDLINLHDHDLEENEEHEQ